MTVMQILDRIKRLRYHEVVVEFPQDFQLKGRVPFDVTVTDQEATFRVLEETEELAQRRVFDFLNQNDES